jgi:hypothetical protein
LVDPAARPFTIAIHEASASDTLRVRLLSMAQARQAPTTSSMGAHGTGPCPGPGHASAMPPATMHSIPIATRRSTFSRNTTQASTAVSTASALSSNEACEAGRRASPSISSTGPATPPATTAAASQRHSPGGSRTRCAPDTARSKASPRPEPR